MTRRTLLEVFIDNTTPDTSASYTYLRDGEIVDRTLTHYELLQRAKGLAEWLKQQGMSGKRALLVFPTGLEFVEAFLACLIANVTTVPVAPVPLTGDTNKAKRLSVLMDDCQPSIVLGVGKTIGNAGAFVEQNPKWSDLTWLEVDTFEGWDAFPDRAIDMPSPTAIAVLQYTSGSTGMPKGVMLSHQNILHNLIQWDHGLGHDDASRIISWVPHFHDLGLLYGILFPMYRSISACLLPGVAVAQTPLRWLKAISDFKGTHSMGPNFMYGHCCQKISEHDCVGLDLSSWRMALNAAEPVSVETVSKFNEKFGRYGFPSNAMTAGYGLAEATCFVTCQTWDEPVRALSLSAKALLCNEVRLAKAGEVAADMVACGKALNGTTVKIVDPARLTECAPDEIGEIWVHSGSVSSGYWNRPDETARTMGATMAGDRGGQQFLRTGDLGFVNEGDLFTTGRIKDLIIVHGDNYYPQDAEREIGRAHPGFAPGGCAVFPVTRDGEERIVVVQELTRAHRGGPYDEMFGAIRRAVGAAFDLPVYAIVLIQPGTTAKTSSGKIQRNQSKRAFLEGGLRVVAKWEIDPDAKAPVQSPMAACPSSAVEVEAFLTRRAAEISQVSQQSVRADRPFSEYGLGSIDAASLATELASRFNVEVSPTEFYDHPSIRQLAHYLSRRIEGERPQAKTAALASCDPDSVVVVGMACRFPGAGNLAAYWDLLSEGRSGITSRRHGDGTVRHGGFLDDLIEFDNAFFSITNREAACMDPQQRIAMQVAWHALEDAGIKPDAIAGTDTGVFFGASAFDYGLLQLTQAELDAYSSQGSVLAVIANRIAYQLDLHGPSFVVDTACSSALTAVHLACRSLRDAECRMAIVGAVNVLLASEWDEGLIKAGMLAPDGQCKTFDASANGYVRSEGCGALVLKRYQDAVADGDRIYGAIVGSTLNQDGRSNGLTAPSGSAQEALVLSALAKAKLDPSELQYVEAHGTGTPLGDPIECRALSRVLAQGRSGDERVCHLGSAKANVGHLEAAAGMAGIIKTLLALHHGQIPVQRNLSNLNPLIDLGARIAIPRTGVAWPRQRGARRHASVNAFGFSGTNACVVVGDAECAPPDSHGSDQTFVEKQPSPVLPFVMSARDKPALRRLAARFAAHLESLPERDWLDFVYTSTCRRALQDTRFAVAADSAAGLAAKLRALADGSDLNVTEHGSRRAPRIAFVYSGQGIPLEDAGWGLFQQLPAFREALARCDAILAPQLGFTLETLLYGHRADIDLTRPSLAQPVHFALQYALGQTLSSLGIRADVTLGHSLGEYAALVTSGAMSVEAALGLVAVRGDLCGNQIAPGAMAAVFADEETISRTILQSGIAVDLAAINGQHHCVVAGSIEAVTQFCAYLDERHSIEHRKLRVERPYHSRLMEPVMPALVHAAEAIEFQTPSSGFISNVTGEIWAPGRKLTGQYFARHLREPVRFADSLHALSGADVALAIEIGTRPVLCGIGEACQDGAGPRWLPLLRQTGHDHEDLVECLVQIAGAGYEVDWRPLLAAKERRVVSLPGYEFEKVPHWFKQRAATAPSASMPVAARPAWEQVVQCGEAALGSFMAVESSSLAKFEAIWKRMVEVCPLVMAATLAELGVFRQAGETVCAQDIAQRCALKASRLPLLGQWLMALGNAGYLQNVGEGLYRNPEPFDAMQLKTQVAGLLPEISTSEDYRPLVDYVKECATSQAGLLTGTTNPLDLLFPDGESKVADALYQLNPVSRMQNHIAVEALRAMVGRHATRQRRPMRILELGAGTGGTSAALLKVLPATGVVYHFTDVSHFFTDRAKARFAGLPFIEYGLFDINKGFAEQGYEPASFDLILAANAIHAAKHIDETLHQLRRLLVPGGALMLIEGTVNTPIQMLTLAHIESFGHYQDRRKARNLPFMSVDEWRACLLAAGFEGFSAVPGVGHSSQAWPQHLLLACSAEEGGAVASSVVTQEAVESLTPLSAPSPAPMHESAADSSLGTTDALSRLLGKLIHVDAARVDPQATFIELGVDSIVLMEFTHAVSRQHGVKLTVPQIFEHYPSLEKLSRFLDAGEVQGSSIDTAEEV
ncbi:type I polyketide synthase [Caballeronia humi]|uniref:Beta-ketoacyl synthase n=1 Tax=Caballeronia humi TaxID=326474 RepID=A0A158I222_9BURK|nr:type I polyketide synthase [Caballeronia humi]SAL50070.1 beta-ketoacyl synthase [Caballeronia humi]